MPVPRREIEPLAHLEVEIPLERGHHHRRRGRAQRLLHGPERGDLRLGLDDDEAGRIETEAEEAMPVQAPLIGQAASRGHEE